MLLSFVAIIADWLNLTGEGLVFPPVKSLAIRIVSTLTYMYVCIYSPARTQRTHHARSTARHRGAHSCPQQKKCLDQILATTSTYNMTETKQNKQNKNPSLTNSVNSKKFWRKTVCSICYYSLRLC